MRGHVKELLEDNLVTGYNRGVGSMEFILNWLEREELKYKDRFFHTQIYFGPAKIVDFFDIEKHSRCYGFVYFFSCEEDLEEFKKTKIWVNCPSN